MPYDNYSYMSPIPIMYSPQAQAVTGLRTPVPYGEYIRSQAQYLPAMYKQRRMAGIERERMEEEKKRAKIMEQQASREFGLGVTSVTGQTLLSPTVYEKFTKPVSYELYERGIKKPYSMFMPESPVPAITERTLSPLPTITETTLSPVPTATETTLTPVPSVGTTTPTTATPGIGSKALKYTGKAFQLAKPVSAGATTGSLVRQTNIGEYMHKRVGGGEREWDVGLGAATGMAAGAATGAAWGSVVPGLGNIVGAGLGVAAGAFYGYKQRGGCIIVTACTSPDSKEVEICRKFKDMFLGKDELRGYYMLAEQIVPIIKHNDELKDAVKKHLVDRLVDYAEITLGHKTEFKYKDSAEISTKFINICRNIGKTIPRYVRENGEVI